MDLLAKMLFGGTTGVICGGSARVGKRSRTVGDN